MSTENWDPVKVCDEEIYAYEWNNIMAYGLAKPCGILVHKRDGVCEALDGTTGMTVGTSDADLFVVLASILTDNLKVYVRQDTYSVADVLSILNSQLEIEFEPGTTITSSGSGEGIKVGSDDVEPLHVRLIGNGCHITRASLGGTYGVHFENAHLCELKDFNITKFATASVYFEGSWGSWIKQVEVKDNPGQNGVLLRATQAGAHTANLGDLVSIEQSWLQGTVNGIWVRDNPEKVVIRNNDIHDSGVGILDDGSRNLAIEDNYFEANTGYLIHLKGTDAPVTSTNIERNFLATDSNINMVYVENADIVNIRQNDLNPPVVGCKLVGTPADSTNRNILLDRNRLGIPAWVTEYNGNAESLAYHLSCYLQAFLKFPGMGTDLLPLYDGSYALGSASKRFTHLYLQGNIKDINAIEHELDPATDNTYSLGNAGLKWSNLHTVLVTASGAIYSGGNVNTDGAYQKGGLQVVGARQSAITDVSVTGSAQDSDARTKINSILAALRTHGLISST